MHIGNSQELPELQVLEALAYAKIISSATKSARFSKSEVLGRPIKHLAREAW